MSVTLLQDGRVASVAFTGSLTAPSRPAPVRGDATSAVLTVRSQCGNRKLRDIIREVIDELPGR